MKEIKSFKKSTLANTVGVIYCLVGFFMAIGIAISAMINIIMQKNFTGSILVVILFNIGTGLLVGLIVAFVTAVIGWVIGFVIAGVYNIFAKRFGGIVFELGEAKVEDEKEDEDKEDEA